MKKLVTPIYILILAGIAFTLSFGPTRDKFVSLTRSFPFLLGFIKIALLGTMGELLSGRIVTGNWKFSGIRLHQRVLVWGFLGILFTVVFPIFSIGTTGLVMSGLLPGKGHNLAVAFWSSFFMNMIFAFPMMVFHRITDTLIDRGQLFTPWPLVEVYTGIDWKNMFHIAGFSCIWFWIPAHTFTFMLPPEFRVVSAAFLSLALGLILGYGKRKAFLKSKE
ncbi:hypothetical protein KKF34_16395 [Myxococcota bacterium]|nr:hypothetical protein [Myxococcota bacterium]MBU1382310.1 hypothetical protein [Myxococcota bacterium]MBU1498458.1 hypothetical protein [Myxococcota bacterium]